jgi:hypothetical protein
LIFTNGFHDFAQLAVLDRLEHHARAFPPSSDQLDHPTNTSFTSWLAIGDMAGPEATRSKRASIRRAVLQLASEGLVQTLHIRKHVQTYSNGNFRLCARLTPDAVTAAE